MTGGCEVVLGQTGRNFAAGMSGGVAYVLDKVGDFHNRCNLDTVTLDPLEDPQEIAVVREMVQRHARYTHSELGWRVLAMWDELAPKFVKVMPKDYRRMLEAVKRAEAAGLSGDDAVMVAFEDNKDDAARVSGN
jgi:glutamate synthase (ferredoxin)